MNRVKDPDIEWARYLEGLRLLEDRLRSPERESLRRTYEMAMPSIQMTDAEARKALFDIAFEAKKALGITSQPIGCAGD